MFDPWVVLSNLSDPVTLLLMTLSACFGIIMGAVPGLSGTLGIALAPPFTFGLESATALLMLWFRVLRLQSTAGPSLPFSSILRERRRPSAPRSTDTLWP